MDSLTSSNIAAPHGFFTRNGGVSDGIFASLNCGPGSGDDKANVAENRKRVAAHFNLPPQALLTLYQVHSANSLSIHATWEPEAQAEADALVTKTPGLLLGILTADCAPVLLADCKAGVIAAAHAGWKGAHSGIIQATVAAMCELGARVSHIHAAIGPCIAQESYEVGPEFVERINDVRFFAPAAGGKAKFDLKAYVRHRLHTAGIADIHTLPHDTCAEEADFFSYRRATLRRETGYGRQISCITL